jgi:3-deoxy-D-manno-octulosonate 8-phosphate phosphatase (KDO 8-P phosphatase)
MQEISNKLKAKASKIKFLLTDCDGVLTDGTAYYSQRGEEMKKFSFRDGMGVERLRTVANIETGIITGETSDIVLRRTEKLRITEYYPGIRDKYALLKDICRIKELEPKEIAYIGDDMNDLEIMKHVGLTACPADAMPQIAEIADIITASKGGCGAFREFAEFILAHCLDYLEITE